MRGQQQISRHDGYILVERSPDYEVVLADQPKALEEIAAECEDAGSRKVLLLGNGTKVRLSLMDVFELGQKIAAKNLQIAVVESHDASTASVEFLESVATIRGGPIRFFDDEKEAREWLEIS